MRINTTTAAVLPPVAETPRPGQTPGISERSFQELARQLLAERGLDLKGYKDRYIKRRIAVRLRARGCAELRDYLRLLAGEPAEWDRLSAALAINVSHFFRNPETFAVIRTRVLPEVIRARKELGQPRLRLWSAGCADGEETYTLALLLREYFPGPTATMAVSVLGTDIDEESLAAARQGEYAESQFEEMPPELREKYFLRRGEAWAVRRRLAGMVHWQHHDLLRDPAPEDLDLIVCRNVLIYLSREEQEKILLRFHAGLRPGGYLVLGKTESLVGRLRGRFQARVPEERIYQRTMGSAGREAIG